jgi:hypothetical protein
VLTKKNVENVRNWQVTFKTSSMNEDKVEKTIRAEIETLAREYLLKRKAQYN